MNFEFGEKKSIKRLLVPFLVLVGFVWLPFSWFLVYVSIDSGEAEVGALSAVLIVVLGGSILRHLHNLYQYPLVEIADKYMIITEPLRKRVPYEVKKIGRVRLFGKALFFTHRGWPAIATLHGVDSDQRSELVRTLSRR